MKKKDLERRLYELGWKFARHGGNHDAWTNGKILEFIPKHNEIKEGLAKKIIRRAENNPPQSKG